MTAVAVAERSRSTMHNPFQFNYLGHRIPEMTADRFTPAAPRRAAYGQPIRAGRRLVPVKPYAVHPDPADLPFPGLTTDGTPLLGSKRDWRAF
jgi:hypothetical protein